MKRKVIYLKRGANYDLTGDGRFEPKILRKDKKMYNKRRRAYEKRLFIKELHIDIFTL